MRFLTLDLKTKLITSESTFRRSLCRMVVYEVLQLKVKIDVFLTWILLSIVQSEKILHFPEFLTA